MEKVQLVSQTPPHTRLMPTHSAWGTDPDQPVDFSDYCDPSEQPVAESPMSTPEIADLLEKARVMLGADSATATGLDDDWLGDDEYDDNGQMLVAPRRKGVPYRLSLARNPRLARAFDRRRKVVELKIAGYTFAEIADQLGFNSVDGARDAFQRAQKDTADIAEEWRTLTLARFERMVAVLWPMIETGDLEAMDKLLKISAQTIKITKMDSVGAIGHGPGERGETVRDVVERIAMVEDVNQFLAMLPGMVNLSPQPASKMVDEFGQEVHVVSEILADNETETAGAP